MLKSRHNIHPTLEQHGCSNIWCSRACTMFNIDGVLWPVWLHRYTAWNIANNIWPKRQNIVLLKYYVYICASNSHHKDRLEVLCVYLRFKQITKIVLKYCVYIFALQTVITKIVWNYTFLMYNKFNHVRRIYTDCGPQTRPDRWSNIGSPVASTATPTTSPRGSVGTHLKENTRDKM